MPISLAVICCSALLSATEVGNVYLPGSLGYTNSLGSYYSQQAAALSPSCIAAPTSAEQVSVIVRALVGNDCRFAVRSGGHTMHAGSANIACGVTVDLQGLDSIELNQDESIASIGPGATWGQVYQTLDPLGLTVLGGRDATVGVAGLTLGGGISWLSPRYGWACDMVQRFQIVLADGTIATVDDETRPDLLFALRGGSNNFGIVTRFDFKTIEHGQMLGGLNLYDVSTIDRFNKEVVGIATGAYDEYATFFATYSYTSSTGSALVITPTYTKPVANPSVFEGIRSLPTLFSTVRITNMSDLITSSSNDGVGRRNLFRTTTFAANEDVLKAVYSYWQESVSRLAGIEGLSYLMLMQPLPRVFYQRHASTNALGLQDRNEDLMIALIWPTWDDPADNELVTQETDILIEKIELEAKRLNAFDGFKYLNYAAQDQDPLASYGQENVKRLKEIQQKYDPHGVFTKNMPGGFKLSNVNAA
ncbi:hypothetical protein B0I35DRAFT_517037 [Stachybotrys elegans]|uniref:FAD-binding PCMH-type domain-containing protein n=1 Tax=Stachybotrys elegans TaxID=80388 RepID=A0A8K0SCU7_9HYPO|nr:hypothetical protein B0I35DRAFT_517037 [Stachybotrys elegans]